MVFFQRARNPPEKNQKSSSFLTQKLKFFDSDSEKVLSASECKIVPGELPNVSSIFRVSSKSVFVSRVFIPLRNIRAYWFHVFPSVLPPVASFFCASVNGKVTNKKVSICDHFRARFFLPSSCPKSPDTTREKCRTGFYILLKESKYREGKMCGRVSQLGQPMLF